MIGESDAMRRVTARLRQVAPLDTTVLLTGESGTGKELAERLLHDDHPKRKNGPFVCLHAGAIPDTLLESELFGHVRGAFTGAERDHVGKLEQANGGTLFLDEISTMKPDAQIRLLRVLQERKVTRVGSQEARPVDVRVIVASNQPLKNLVDAGTFRLDLYYRVSTFPVTLPTLRERAGDILPLVEYFSQCTAARLQLAEPKHFSPESLQALSLYPWPGNVRQLENAVEYACIVSDERDTIRPEDLPEEIHSVLNAPPALPPGLVVTEQGLSFRTAVSNLERELILQSLRLADGNKARAAELLELKRTTFLEKLKRLEDEGMISEVQPDWPVAAEA